MDQNATERKAAEFSPRTAFFLVMVLVIPTALVAQEKPKSYHHFIQAGYQFSFVLKTNDFVKGINLTNEPIDWAQSARVEFGWQATGEEMWQQIWGYPAFGFGFYRIDYFEDGGQLGEPLSIYGFAVWPLKRMGRVTLSTELGFGVSFNWNPFNPATNPYNIAIGDFNAAHIDIGVTLGYRVSRQFHLIGAFTATHFSNGGTTKPNSGINQMGLMAMLRYDFEKEPLTFKQWQIAEYQKNWEWLVSGSYGIRNRTNQIEVPDLTNAYLRRDFAVTTLTSTIYRQISYKSKFGAGIDLVYDRSINNDKIISAEGEFPAEDVEDIEEFRLGFYGAYEFVFYRLSVLLNIGYSVIEQDKTGLPKLYQRLGAKYHIFKNFFGGLNVRFQNFEKANHLEFNIGYRIQMGK